MAEITVYKNRTNKIRVRLGQDVSGDTFSAEIRAKASSTSDLIATWAWEFETDGTDGDLILTLDNTELDETLAKSGYTDVKRMSGGEPLPVFAPIKVVIVDTVTP
jgi:hypothetical protein